VHTGAFAVVGLGLLMMFSYAAAIDLKRFDLQALIFIPVISRCGSAFCVLTLKPIGHSEYAKTEGKSAHRVAVAAMWLIAVVVCAVWLKALAIALLVETIVYAAAMAWACHTLKGVSGDVAGFALSAAECAGLIALSSIHLPA
jgi:adenosylcobinamide-GDP ribazoletransferase